MSLKFSAPFTYFLLFYCYYRQTDRRTDGRNGYRMCNVWHCKMSFFEVLVYHSLLRKLHSMYTFLFYSIFSDFTCVIICV